MTRKRPASLWEEEQIQIDRRPCDIPSCTAEGAYRAPKGRDRLREYFWFCLDHVRAYNQTWDYFSGMSEAEIERHIRRDTTWQRPSWPWAGARARHAQGPRDDRLRASMNRFYEAFAEDADDARRHRHANGGAEGVRAHMRRLSAEAESALAVMELEPPVSLSALKAQYKTLVKRHHPDANGGDKLAEERLKSIIQAYATLKTIVADLAP